jgi:hypothetical protein
MNRRQFLVGGSAATAAIATRGITSNAQAPAAGGGQGRAGGRGRGRGANLPAEKLARLSLMTLNFDQAGLLKLPWRNARPTQTVDILDLPQYYMDQYRVPNMELQADHVASDPENTPPDPAFLKELRAKLDAAKVAASQINLEIGGMGNLSAEAQPVWLALAKKWVDLAPILGVTRLMVIQDGLAEDTKANCIAVWKPLSEYARPKGIMISAETRGGGGGRRGGAPAAPPARPGWMLLQEVIEASDGYSNVDLGGVGATNQQDLHACIKAMYARSSGNMHIKSSPLWDIGTAVRYTESLGYKGLYSIEVNPEPAIGIVYNTILASL